MARLLPVPVASALVTGWLTQVDAWPHETDSPHQAAPRCLDVP